VGEGGRRPDGRARRGLQHPVEEVAEGSDRDADRPEEEGRPALFFRHLYISVWYLGAAILWGPFLLIAFLLPIYSGVPEATANWWYAHNILGLWITPPGLAAPYYFIPKVIGRPVYSYHLSYLGFWTLALFYNWAGVHHLVGGPVPQWLETVSITFSAMMIIPVIVVAVNHHMTIIGHFKKLKYSPTLRFVVFGAMSYTTVSLHR
jgi:cytochrome c oxidase cbb3-type subunit 1